MNKSLLMAYLFLSIKADPVEKSGIINGYRLEGEEPPELRLGELEPLDRLLPPL